MKKVESINPLNCLFLVTLLYFALAFVNITLALLALFCFTIPFILILTSKKKLWCIHYCPRSSLLKFTGKVGRNRKVPGWIISRKMRTAILNYFCINFLFITLSSIMVSLGRVAPMDFIRFFIVIPTNWRLLQLVEWVEIPPVLLHLSYRFYSVMLSSTIAGAIVSLMFKPKTWCAVCPVNTLSAKMLKSIL